MYGKIQAPRSGSGVLSPDCLRLPVLPDEMIGRVKRMYDDGVKGYEILDMFSAVTTNEEILQKHYALPRNMFSKTRSEKMVQASPSLVLS